MRILKEATMEAMELRISRVTEPIVWKAEVRSRILVEEDI